MCGIAGILVSEPSIELKLLKMLKKQNHRGPDLMKYWKTENEFLGHNRLSILDLSHEADQPMKSNDGRFVIVFNGEIYNYIELRRKLKYLFKSQ